MSLSVGSLTKTFDLTTRSVEPSGLFTGTGTVNTDAVESTTLTDIKAMVFRDHFLLFDVTEHLLYEGNITSYSGNNFTATVDVYKDSLFVKQETATGAITNKSTLALVLTGTDYGLGTIDLTYSDEYEKPATLERIAVPESFWWGWSPYSSPRGDELNTPFLLETRLTKVILSQLEQRVLLSVIMLMVLKQFLMIKQIFIILPLM